MNQINTQKSKYDKWMMQNCTKHWESTNEKRITLKKSILDKSKRKQYKNAAQWTKNNTPTNKQKMFGTIEFMQRVFDVGDDAKNDKIQ